jgi:hypothetical protein
VTPRGSGFRFATFQGSAPCKALLRLPRQHAIKGADAAGAVLLLTGGARRGVPVRSNARGLGLAVAPGGDVEAVRCTGRS